MPRILASRYADMVHYNSADGRLRVQLSGNLWEASDIESLDAVLAAAALDAHVQAFVAAYGLALAAHMWHHRPTDMQRGALIQLAERVQSDCVRLVAVPLLTGALVQADAALIEKGNAEQAVSAFVGAAIRRADRAAERCGRHGAGLVEEGDWVLTFGFGGPPLLALLNALPEATPAIRLVVAGGNATPLLALATMPAINVREASQLEAFSQLPNVCIIATLAVATDGSAICERGVGNIVHMAREHGVPCYVLAPSGPVPDLDLAAVSAERASLDIVGPQFISAIITDRGLYRPAMLTRYASGGEAPLDVIPLS